jgi:hypothetical protein
MREIGLNQLFDEKTNTEKVNRYKRKFDYLTDAEKNIVLLKNLIVSINDRFRNNMDIIEWTVEKSAKTYNLNPTDFDCVKNLTLSQILEIVK